MRRIKLILLIMIITLTTTSCWSRREIENLGFVLGLGVSKTESGLYTIVAQVANPKYVVAEAPNQRDVYTIFKAEGLTVFDALRNLSMISGRRLYLAHIKALVLDESIAKEGVGEIIGFLVQDMEVRLEIDVFVSKLPPEEIFDTPNTLGSIPALVMEIMAINYGANSKVYVAELHDTVDAINNPVTNYVTGLLEKIPSPSDNEKEMFRLVQTAVFDHDRLAGYLDYEEGQGYNFITNNFRNAVIVFESKSSGDLLTIEVLDSKAVVKAKLTDTGVGFDIVLKVRANVAERVPKNPTEWELDIEEVTLQLNHVLMEKMSLAMEAAQIKYGIDIFNLSKYFYRAHPAEFKELEDNWNKVFSKAQINYEVDSIILHTALNQNRGRI